MTQQFYVKKVEVDVDVEIEGEGDDAATPS